MLTKYLELQSKFEKLESDLQNPAILNDAQKLKEVSQEYTDIKPTVEMNQIFGFRYIFFNRK